MACATLKRTLELEPLTSPRPSKRRRGLALMSSRASYVMASPPPPPKDNLRSPFAFEGLSTEVIRSNIHDEMRRLYRRRRLFFDHNVNNEEESSTSTSPSSSSTPHTSFKTILKQRDRPIFSYQQVEMICERMIRERENELFEKFSEILTTKLLDQYDTYVKYTHEEIKQKMEAQAAPSYLS